MPITKNNPALQRVQQMFTNRADNLAFSGIAVLHPSQGAKQSGHCHWQ
ncbi:hypothetical protein N8843_05275 [Verrucomicrobia bacterium]|nr:hypothetical protein [Verrucomicrobiota bacterium]